MKCVIVQQALLPNGAEFLILFMDAFLRQDLTPGLAFFAEGASLFKTEKITAEMF